MKEDKILGIIGGMGPLATQVFYGMLTEKTEASLDQEHVDAIILSHTSIPDRTHAILSGHEEDVYKKLLDDARFLENAGVCAIVITCNTSHYFADRLQNEINIPLINMIEESAKHIAGLKKGASVMICATDGTIRSGLYQEALFKMGLSPCVPDEKGQKTVMSIIYDYVKAGKPVPESLKQDFFDIKKCDYAVMACTELSCFKEQEDLGEYYVDPMEVLAEQAILFCGKKLKAK